MSVELKVTLVGEDPQQQAAFNNPQSVSPSSAAPVPDSSGMPREHFPRIDYRPLPQSQQPAQSAPQQPQPQQRSTPSPTAQPSQPATQPQVSTSQPVSTDQRLINTLEQLIEVIDNLATTIVHQHTDMMDAGSRASGSGHNRNHQSANQSFFERIAESINRKIDEMGLAHTAVGDLVTGSAGRFADLATRATKFAGSAFGMRSAGTAASAAAAAGTGTAAAASGTGGAAAAGGAAASGAAGTGAGAAATGALATASGPLLAVALAAGAAALTLKAFMNAVERTAADLADLSPDIAIGRAQHEVKMELMRLDRANRIGSDVANIDGAQHRLTESMYELQTKIYDLILKASPAIETGIDMLNVIVRTLDVLVATANNLAAKFTPDPTDDAPAAKGLADAMKGLQDAIHELGTIGGHGGGHAAMDPLLSAILQADVIGKPKRGQKP